MMNTLMVWTLALGLIALTAHARGAEGHTLYVAPNGNDQASGKTLQEPLATLTGARDAIRKLQPLKKPVTVILKGGSYAVTEPTVFGPEDPGNAGLPHRLHRGER